ncbi:hypothetical protein [Stenotrophomonas sp.]|uniref:hypothetical protein n=1 Tax=Stenotrophomonas sp. TaxID=69392 RepID=UPI00289EC525|nr:hypothetical protein [Stenotrophomonas sp.]
MASDIRTRARQAFAKSHSIQPEDIESYFNEDCMSIESVLSTIESVLLQTEGESVLCYPNPCAYQRRDTMPADTGGHSQWHEIGREFYMQLERLQIESPWVVRGIELRKLYASKEDSGCEF